MGPGTPHPNLEPNPVQAFFCKHRTSIVCLFDCLEKLAVQPNSENLAVQPNHEKPIIYEVGFAQNTISKTGNSLQVMGYTQNLRWVLPNEKGHAQSITNLTGNSLQGMGYIETRQIQYCDQNEKTICWKDHNECNVKQSVDYSLIRL